MNMARLAVVGSTVKRQSRRYDASGRRAAARETRARIVDTGHRLFLERGYAATRMAEVAQEAGVSLETVYTSVGTKSALIRHLVEIALSGTDEPVPALERASTQEIRDQPDPRQKLVMFAGVVRRLNERVAPLWALIREAAAGDPELKALADELDQRRAGHMRVFVAESLEATGALRPGLSLETAADIVWATNAPEFFLLLVRDRGWDADFFERWLADTWTRLLLG
jgi:AcrR family transcriptional regulator